MRIVLSACAAWATALWSYVLALRSLYGEELVGGDFRAVVIWTALAAAVLTPTAYHPVLQRIRRRNGGCRPWLIFPIAASLLFVAPTIFIMLGINLVGALLGYVPSLTAVLRTPFTPEAGLFYIAFLTFGAVFGLGFVWSRYESAV